MFHRSFRVGSRFVLITLLAVLTTFVPRLAEAQNGARQVGIRKVAADNVAGTMTIYGRNFCLNPVVTLSTTVLEVLSAEVGEDGADSITVAMPANTPPAGYRLTVECGANNKGASQTDSFDLGGGGAVGDVGPEGPRGRTGADGAPGAAGPQGEPGARGPAGRTGLDGVPGANGVLGLEYVTQCLPVVCDGCITTYEASCPGAKKVLSGAIAPRTEADCSDGGILGGGKPIGEDMPFHSGWRGYWEDNADGFLYFLLVEIVCATES